MENASHKPTDEDLKAIVHSTTSFQIEFNRSIRDSLLEMRNTSRWLATVALAGFGWILTLLADRPWSAYMGCEQDATLHALALVWVVTSLACCYKALSLWDEAAASCRLVDSAYRTQELLLVNKPENLRRLYHQEMEEGSLATFEQAIVQGFRTTGPNPDIETHVQAERLSRHHGCDFYKKQFACLAIAAAAFILSFLLPSWWWFS